MAWLFDSTPKVPDFIEPDRCFRCEASNLTNLKRRKGASGPDGNVSDVDVKRNHRPCFQVGCYCHCSHVPGYIA